MLPETGRDKGRRELLGVHSVQNFSHSLGPAFVHPERTFPGIRWDPIRQIRRIRVDPSPMAVDVPRCFNN